MRSRAATLVAAACIDLVYGEPPARLHPVVLIGRALGAGARLESLMFTANHLHKLEPDLDALDRAEKAVGRQLASVATPAGRAAMGVPE
ncbi:MAG: hypothetical protein ACREPI_07485 [Candidatus Dormibacterales bacterium]